MRYITLLAITAITGLGFGAIDGAVAQETTPASIAALGPQIGDGDLGVVTGQEIPAYDPNTGIPLDTGDQEQEPMPQDIQIMTDGLKTYGADLGTGLSQLGQMNQLGQIGSISQIGNATQAMAAGLQDSVGWMRPTN